MFLNLLFPDTLALGMTGGPRFATLVAPSPSGDEALQSQWPAELGAWTLDQRHRTDAETIALLSLFRIACGRAHGFLLHDPTDDTGTDELLGTGDGVETDFPLLKHYDEAPVTYVRPILKPVVSSVTAALTGVPTVGFTVDTVTGALTFTPAPVLGALVTASFTYYIPVRFDMDQCTVSMVEPGVSTWSGIRLIELNAASGI